MTRVASPRLGENRPADIAVRLRILLMGTPEILCAGKPFNLNHLKAQALLYYLAATGKVFTRAHLATLLWSDAGSAEALHSLRSSLYHLRQSLRSGGMEILLVSQGDWLSLQPGSFECDLAEFRRLFGRQDEASLVEAASLYRGPFLQGFSLVDAPAFDEWQQGQEARLSQEYTDVLIRFVDRAEARRDWPAVIQTLQRLMQIDPLDEPAVQRLIRACLQQGEIGLALGSYQRFEKMLQQELDLSPTAETRDLLTDILRSQRRPARPLNAFSGSLVQVRAPLPFIGRNHMLDRLNLLSRKVRAGHGSTALLEGEAGIGKTRLIDEFAGSLEAASQPWIILRGACSPFDDLLSYGPFLEALQNASGKDLPIIPVELDPSLPDTRGRFSWRILQAIRSLTHSLPLLLIIEDLQWANSASLNLYAFLSMRLQHLPVLLVGSVQHANSIPALQRLIHLGRRRGDLELFSLSPLPLEGVAALLRAHGIEANSIEDLADWMYVRSTGNPFLLNEILAQLHQEGLLQPVGESWRLDASRWWHWRTSFELPETTHDLVAWRLASLSPEALHILEILAVAGQPLPAFILSDFPGVPSERYSDLVDDLAARRLIIEPPGGKVALPHHLLRMTILQRLSNLHRRDLHRQLAQALEAHMSWEEHSNLLQLAMHSVAGEDVGRARRYGLAMLPHLPQDYAGAETLDFVQHLHDLLASSASADEMATLARALGALHLSLGRLEPAAQWLKESLAWAEKAGDTTAQAEANLEMSELALMSNDHRRAMESARAGLARISTSGSSSRPATAGSSALKGRGLRLLGAAYAMEGSDLAAAERHLHEAVTALRQAEHQDDLCAALFELGNIAAQRGELQAALDFYDEAARTAGKNHIHYYLALACNNFAYHNLLMGRIEAAERSASQGVKVAETYDLLAALLHLYSTRGEIHLYLGEWEQAEDSFRRGLAIAEDLGSLERKAGYRGGLALAARGKGDLPAAVELLKKALFLIGDAGYWHLHTRLQIWLAETYFLQGRFSDAAGMIAGALDIARQHHRTLLLAQGECLQAQLLGVNGDWEAARALFSEAIERSEGLGIPLETARLEGAWGKALLQYSPHPGDARPWIEAARTTFEACRALAELAALPPLPG
jgi:DNA-binding SARP family transcriptional activator